MSLTQHLYRHFGPKGELLYVGVSLSTLQRLGQHKNNSHWYNGISEVKIERFNTRKEALEAEKQAIVKENPLHNKLRPKNEEEKPPLINKRAQQSYKALVTSLVQVKPLYTIQGAANLLTVSTGQINKWIEDGKLSYVPMGIRWDTRWKCEREVKRITGFQILDFLENWQAGKFIGDSDKEDTQCELK